MGKVYCVGVGILHRTLQERAIFFHHRGQFWGIPGEMRAICFGGVAFPILDTAGYDPRKTARKFWPRLEPQNTTNIAWTVLGTFQPRFHGTLGRNFGDMRGT